jgi:hypothetical protein
LSWSRRLLPSRRCRRARFCRSRRWWPTCSTCLATTCSSTTIRGRGKTLVLHESILHCSGFGVAAARPLLPPSPLGGIARRAVVNDDDVAPGMEVLCGFFDAVSCCRPSTLMNSPAAPPRPLRATTWRWLAYRQPCHGRRRGMHSLGLTGAPKPGWAWQPFALPSDFCVASKTPATP